LLDEIDELKKSLSKREKEIAAVLTKIEGEKKVLQDQMTRDEEVLKKQAARREVVIKRLESPLYRLYNTLTEKRKGVGVVSARQETCQGLLCECASADVYRGSKE